VSGGVRAPLADVRIISIEQYGAGPFGTLHLADLGAEVIKIENPRDGGDVGRYVPPHQQGESSLFFETFNRNKRSMSLDIGSRPGRRVFEDLVRVSDAVFSNLRGDLPERLRIRYDDLAPVNPRIVCCALTGFGQTGPRQADPGYDYVVQGLTGWMSAAGEPGGPPQKTGFSTVDYGGGLVAAMSLLVGVHAARRDGVGGDCDVSLFDTALSMVGYPATWYLHAGDVVAPTRHSAHPSLVPFQNFATADGWIVVACPKEKFFARLCEAIDREDLLAEERFTGFDNRRLHRDALLAELEPAFASRTSQAWLARLAEHGVPSGPVNDVRQALEDPQTAARGMIVETDSATFGTVRSVASPVRFGDQPTAHAGAPGRGEHTRQLLTELLGYDEPTIDELRTDGAFGVPATDSATATLGRPA
jgi:crotonobetainyl-CoA:carnitine CoA-transferase CaiB-like acyl-CoA transferase